MRLGGPHILPVSMFFGSFAWSFVYVSLPFHIQAISTADPVSTLRWTGWILGISSLVTVVTAPVWGRFAAGGDPKTFYVVVEVLQGLGFLGMAAARTLPELFLARFVLGFMGATSTFAFIMAGRATESGAVRGRVAAVQSAMTVGQVVGPLAGAIAAARMGFRESFVLGGVILWGCAALVKWGVPSQPEPARRRAAERPARMGDVARVSLIILAGSTQVFFLPAILPQVIPDLGVAAPRTLEVGGLLIFASGAAAALGALLTPWLGELLVERRLIVLLLVASSGFLALLGAVHSVWPYGVLRFLQVLCIAPVFPLVVARIAQHAGGTAIGVINSARIGAAFVGPVVATTMLAWTSAPALYLLLGAMGIACLPLAAVAQPRARA
ncbi:MAG: MFS transporter [Candidatus Rokubacteria bacterium]|nr:MFS transporter [Candidatus Rokubacteria bacterium]